MVSEGHVAGLSTPQQTLMSLLSLQELMPKHNLYNKEIKTLLRKRITDLCAPIKYKFLDTGKSSHYYIVIDLLKCAEGLYDAKFAQWIHKHIDPLDFVFILAKKYSTVLLPGVGFAAPPWSVRVSLANLPTIDYKPIGVNLQKTFNDIYNEYKRSYSSKLN